MSPKKYIFILLFLSLIKIASAQSWAWADAPVSYYTNRPSSIATNNGASVIMVGSVSFSTVAFSTFTLSNYSDDMYVVKYDSSGNVLWAKIFGGPSPDYITSVATDTADNIYITGFFQGNSILFGSTVLTNTNTVNSNAFLTKLNKNGTVIWAKNLGENVFPKSLTINNGSTIHLAGSFSNAAWSIGTQTLSSQGSTDLFISCFDLNANVLWAKGFGGAGSDYILQTTTDNSGNIYLAGKYYSSSLTFDTFTINCGGGCDAFLTKLDSLGNTVWVKTVSTAGSEVYNSIALDALGNIYVAGYYSTSDPNIIIGTYTLNVISTTGAPLFVKYAPNGSPQWAKTAYSSIYCNAFSVSSFSTGVYFSGSMLGGTMLIDSSTLNAPAGATNPSFIIRTDFNGNITYSTSLADGGVQSNYIVSISSADAFFSGCYKSNNFIFGNDTLNQNPLVGSHDNSFLSKFSSATSMAGISELQSANCELDIYPNPTNGLLTIITNGEKQTIQVYNIIGELVLTSELRTTNSELNLSNLPNGIYFIRIGNTTKKIIKQ